MATRKSSIFIGTSIALTSLVVGMVLASRLDLTPASLARDINAPAVNSAPIDGPLDATTFRNIAKDASPSVVSIIVTGRRDLPNVPNELEEFFGFQFPWGNRNGRGQQAPREQPYQGAGSGFIIDKAGYVLTNNHVVAGADEIRVVLSTMGVLDDGLPARIVGRDVLTDSALLQITELPDEPLVESKFGDSEQIAPGDWVMAIGNPFRFSNTVTVGVVSAVGRVAPGLNPQPGRDLPYIQTDAAINQGNSGGPLLNIRGEVVGVNTAIVTGNGSPLGMGGGGNIGIGFAVPINTVRDILPQLREGNVVRGRIGVYVDKREITADDAAALRLPSAGGALVTTTEDDGPADAAGIEPGDVIVEFNGEPIDNSDDLVSTVSATRPGTSAQVRVIRNGTPTTLTVRVDELNPIAEEASAAAERRDAETGFGMSVAPITPQIARSLPNGRGGAIVTDVDQTGAAARSGIFPSDVILKVGGRDVSNLQQVTEALSAVPSGQAVPVLVWRPNERGDGGSETFILLRKN
jgi:serine protease Do